MRKRPLPNMNAASQQGAALIVSLVVLLVVTLLGLSSMESALMQERMASNSQNDKQAFQTNESLLADALPDDSADMSDTFSGELSKAIDRGEGQEGSAITFAGAESPVNATYNIVYRGEVRFNSKQKTSSFDSDIKSRLFEIRMATENTDTQAGATHTQGFTLN